MLAPGPRCYSPLEAVDPRPSAHWRASWLAIRLEVLALVVVSIVLQQRPEDKAYGLGSGVWKHQG
jgi:hypothetical protein